jgi:hypothetical protein
MVSSARPQLVLVGRAWPSSMGTVVMVSRHFEDTPGPPCCGRPFKPMPGAVPPSDPVR